MRIVKPEQRPRGDVPAALSSLERERQRDERGEQEEGAERLGELVPGRADQRRVGRDDRPRWYDPARRPENDPRQQ